MPRDHRTYITVHDGMPDHPKITPLSDPAFRLLVTAWCWCSRYHTDGLMPAATWQRMGPAKPRQDLLDAGMATEQPDGSVSLHDYLEHQRSAEEIEELRRKRAESGSLGGKQRASNWQANAVASAKANAVANGKQNPSKTQADTDTELEEEQNQDQGQGLLIKRAPSTFDPWWSAYPRKVGKTAAHKAYLRSLRSVSALVLLEAAERYRDDPNRDPEFTAHPATWLNRGSWDDEPLPARNGSKPSTGDQRFAQAQSLKTTMRELGAS